MVANVEKENEKRSLDHLFDLKKYHEKGITGKGVKVAIFDSGLAQKYLNQNLASMEKSGLTEKNHEALMLSAELDDGEFEIEEWEESRRLKEDGDLRVAKIIDFTYEKDAVDKIGHGTFISSVVGSKN